MDGNKEWRGKQGEEQASVSEGTTDHQALPSSETFPMTTPRSAPWTAQEIAILRAWYPAEGHGIAPRLPGRSVHALQVKANKLGLTTAHRSSAPKSRLQGEALDEAVRLREVENWSFSAIGKHFGVCEASASNAVTTALCVRRGYRPAERDQHGRLTVEGIERLRYALKKGLKGIDIQLRLGVSAACVSEQRRRYNRELLARGKALLPPPGGGQAYSGARLSPAKRKQVEQLFLQGLGTQKIAEHTGVSRTSCTRIRTRLFRRLRRRGEVLPGCDAAGVRHVHAESARFVTDEQKELLRAMLLDRMPVQRAARELVIGASTAYHLRDAFAAELAAEGQALPPPRRPGRVRRTPVRNPSWPPVSSQEMYAFRRLLGTMGFAEAKAHWQDTRREAARAAREAAAMRKLSFEEQLARVASGELGITSGFVRNHLEPRLPVHSSPRSRCETLIDA
ncbi:hypothetical protein SAMIE_1010700 [Sphingobium amiense]|jgi:hypothetical protein|uniref:Helix-turn-helix domain containing protein n=4 Tax=Sphingomonadaceae TaxID=41297 RepID=A0A494WBC8_9SPHN|nr:hypothetical protein [Sphingobium amiense]BBD97569.1 hypothetical protein SAMIE_1010700 [Sphingobium amiense]